MSMLQHIVTEYTFILHLVYLYNYTINFCTLLWFSNYLYRVYTVIVYENNVSPVTWLLLVMSKGCKAIYILFIFTVFPYEQIGLQ